MGLSGISKSTVSKLCKDIDERVKEFLDRPISGDWPYLWLDATYLKGRQGGRIVSVAAIIAMAVDTDGRREIIGLCVGPSEAETFWTEFLRSLKSRGLQGVKLVISDAHTGLKAAIARVFEATWQRCRVGPLKNRWLPTLRPDSLNSGRHRGGSECWDGRSGGSLSSSSAARSAIWFRTTISSPGSIACSTCPGFARR